jgi:hypothetical protein
VAGEGTDARAAALAVYFRDRASAFSMSADVNDEQGIAGAGMALLDAAKLAETLSAQDQRLILLSEAGRFETMPNDTALFLETPALRAAMQRPLAGEPMSGSDILALLVDTASEE